ncbi:stringent starvation protein SspA [Avibacterium paragallinarum]|uniref:Stringent starvation protein A n=1 Tax=Avibacterium paragallinarum TaxID=728 RepID=A0A0F5EYN6_AVIPA|nr:stringent starvation protein SspA [Avibacterium paragallinarum]KAA6208326.1 stringent starvation protein A [Avibacterium paragallinarum]KKB01626.1 stringent starvation protein A [Avibacterium paragallinarum]MEE3608105.1 stringent starvation protein SspA [Avibacterium paragallinarum]MEE3621046.1 stringent starvation protein SspA [Avibacterium paragallinarum]MEE3668794.1 stringent starvation protein SspA [Avibacterium paragallinarum]
MTSAANKRSIMTLFSNKEDIYCHQVRIVLAEKGVAYETEEISPNTISEDLMELNPYGTLPTLVDRDLVLFNSRIIMEYLDERFPHPPLMPVYPVSRGKSRLLMLRIEQDWYSLLTKAEKGDDTERAAALKQLKEELLAIGPIFNQTPYFMSEEFSLVDCYVAPLLWRMRQLGVEFTGAGSKAIRNYIERVSQRDSFRQSVGELAPRNLMDDK